MSSTIQNTLIDIPSEYIINGKILYIQKYFQLFVDGRHLSKPSHFIKQVHQLCLVDSDQQDRKSVNSIHELEPDIDENQLIQLIIQIPSESLNIGKSVHIEKINSNEEQISGNFKDLYNQSTEIKDIYIKIPENCIERGKTIIIEKEKISLRKTDEYQNEQKHHLSDNPFSKRDHLQSKNMMEIIIEIPPEILNEIQTITIRKEDPHDIAKNFSYHRQSKPNLELTNKD